MKNDTYKPLTDITIPITIELLNTKYAYLMAVRILDGAQYITYQYDADERKVHIGLSPRLSSAAAEGVYHIDRRTWLSLHNCEFNVAGDIYTLRTKGPMCAMPTKVFEEFNYYLTVHKQLSYRERITYTRVWFYCYLCSRRYGGRWNMTVDGAATELQMRRQTLQKVLKDLSHDNWIIRYGTYDFNPEYSHGYNYALPENIE